MRIISSRPGSTVNMPLLIVVESLHADALDVLGNGLVDGL